MVIPFLTLLLILPGFIFTGLAEGASLEYKLGVGIHQRFFMDTRFFVVNDHFSDPSGITVDAESTDNYLILSPDLSLSYGKSISGYILGDVYWLYSHKPESQNETDGELRNAYLSLSKKKFSAKLGLQTFRVGNGLILDSDEPGVTFGCRCSRRLYLNATAARVMDSSPFASITLGYRIGFLEKIELFGTGFRDEDDGIANMVYQPFFEETLQSSGGLFWYGLNTDLFWGNVFISIVAIVEKGAVTLESDTGEIEHDLLAFLADISLSYSVTSQLSGTAFFFISSGDKEPSSGELKTFISPLPYNPRAALFFNGGLGMYDTTDALTLAGVTTAGVVCPGLKVVYQMSDSFTAEMTLALFFPEIRPSLGFPTEDRIWYGWETDLRLGYKFRKASSIFIEGNYFNHGNFFATVEGSRPDPASRLMLGFSVYF